eukprot:scaffold1090_cov265-Pinguiococcus_pyrenoidosus.AAC.30
MQQPSRLEPLSHTDPPEKASEGATGRRDRAGRHHVRRGPESCDARWASFLAILGRGRLATETEGLSVCAHDSFVPGRVRGELVTEVAAGAGIRRRIRLAGARGGIANPRPATGWAHHRSQGAMRGRHAGAHQLAPIESMSGLLCRPPRNGTPNRALGPRRESGRRVLHKRVQLQLLRRRAERRLHGKADFQHSSEAGGGHLHPARHARPALRLRDPDHERHRLPCIGELLFPRMRPREHVHDGAPKGPDVALCRGLFHLQYHLRGHVVRSSMAAEVVVLPLDRLFRRSFLGLVGICHYFSDPLC